MKKLARTLSLVLALMMVLTCIAFAEDELGTIYRQHFGADLTELPITTEDITIAMSGERASPKPRRMPARRL